MSTFYVTAVSWYGRRIVEVVTADNLADAICQVGPALARDGYRVAKIEQPQYIGNPDYATGERLPYWIATLTQWAEAAGRRADRAAERGDLRRAALEGSDGAAWRRMADYWTCELIGFVSR